MAAGLPYDSDAGQRLRRLFVTAIMCGQAYLQSSRIAELCEPIGPATSTVQTRLGVTKAEDMPGAACPGYYLNREPFLDVIRMHRASVNNINSKNVPAPVYEASKQCWDEALVQRRKARLPQQPGNSSGAPPAQSASSWTATPPASSPI